MQKQKEKLVLLLNPERMGKLAEVSVSGKGFNRKVVDFLTIIIPYILSIEHPHMNDVKGWVRFLSIKKEPQRRVCDTQ